MSSKKQYKDTVGLIHPESAWHGRKYLTEGRATIVSIHPSYAHPTWYAGEVTHPDISIGVITISGFRPRRVLIK
jgi:hypothetical protein